MPKFYVNLMWIWKGRKGVQTSWLHPVTSSEEWQFPFGWFLLGPQCNDNVQLQRQAPSDQPWENMGSCWTVSPTTFNRVAESDMATCSPRVA